VREPESATAEAEGLSKDRHIRANPQISRLEFLPFRILHVKSFVRVDGFLTGRCEPKWMSEYVNHMVPSYYIL
jgi:hypothetical protein